MAKAATREPTESARKALEVLLLYTQNRPQLTVAEMARDVEVPLSTVYRYVTILRDLGLLESAGRGSYRVGPRVLTLARAARAAAGALDAIARPIMRRLRDECGETVLLVRRVGEIAVCLDLVESEQAVRLSVEAGQTMRLHEGSAPRLLLSAMPPDERASYLLRLREAGEQLGSQLDERELERVSQSGWTESYEELSEGIWGMAAAIRDRGRIAAALGVAGPLYRLGAPQRQAIVAGTRAAADEISAALGAVSL